MHREPVEPGLLQRRRQHHGQEDIARRHRHPHAEDKRRQRAHDQQYDDIVAGHEHQVIDQSAGQPGGGKRPDNQPDAEQHRGQFGQRLADPEYQVCPACPG